MRVIRLRCELRVIMIMRIGLFIGSGIIMIVTLTL